MNNKILLSFLILCTAVSAQEFSTDLLKKMKPRSIGPAGMSGRVTAIDVVVSNPDIMYVGTASGGLWKSTSGGIKWEPIFDKETTASIGAVAIQQSNPSVIWAGTGEGNPRNSLNSGFGIYKSLDGGKNWKMMGLENTRHIHRVIVDPSNPNVVYVAAIGSPWGEHPERGVFKTIDGGETWNKILFVNNKTGAADLVMDSSNPNKLIVSLWEHKRDPWFFKSGGEGSGLYITHDGGKTWSKKLETDGLPKGNLGRIGIAIAKNKPNVVYALIEAEKNALYKSEDGGFKWKMINDKKDIGDRPFYYSEIYVDPQNENRVFSIFTTVNVSEDGGKNFSALMASYGSDYGIHPDHHAYWIHPENGNFMIDGNDGGLNISRDGGKTWRFIGNLPVAQFYHVNVDNEFPYNVYGGMQDNGSWRGPAYVWKVQGIRNSYWQEIAFGDGFDVIPDRDDSRYGWAMSQQGFVVRYDHITGNSYIVRPTHPDPKVELRFNWNAAINIDPSDNSTIYFGSQFLHKSKDKGLTWSIISPDLTSNDSTKLKQSESGGLTMDATGAENHCTILVIEPSTIEKELIWVGTDDGRVQLSLNAGSSWSDVSMNIKDLPKGSWIEQIKASNKNKGEAFLVATDYRRFNYAPYAYRTTDYGKTWERLVDQTDVKSFALCIVEDPKEKNLLFLGTDDGLYFSIDAGKKWDKWTNGFPTVPVKDLVIHPREDDLVIGTFGRAAWILDDIKPLRALARNKEIVKQRIQLFDPPVGYQAAYQQPSGTRFGGDATYSGQNRPFGAPISYYLTAGKKKDTIKKDIVNKEDAKKAGNKNTKLKKAIDEVKEEKTIVSNDSLKSGNKVKWDSIILKIYDKDRLIRTLKEKASDSSGIYKMYWLMEEKGPDNPSRKIEKKGNEQGGTSVKPGIYRLVMEYGDQKSESKIEVKADPRLAISPKNTEEVYDASKNLEKMRQTAADVVKQLAESKEIANKYELELEKKDKTLYKDQIKSSKDIIKKIEENIALYLGKEDKRQGIIRNKEMTVSQRLQVANGYVESRQNGLTSTETTLIKNAENSLLAALDKTNAFFSGDWKNYKEAMQKIDMSPFKETKIFSIK